MTEDDRQTNQIDAELDQKAHCKDAALGVHGTGSNDRVVRSTGSNDHGVPSVPVEMTLIEIVVKQICEPIGGFGQEAEMILTIVDHIQSKVGVTVNQRSEMCRLKTGKKCVEIEVHRRKVVRIEKTKATQRKVKNQKNHQRKARRRARKNTKNALQAPVAAAAAVVTHPVQAHRDV